MNIICPYCKKRTAETEGYPRCINHKYPISFSLSANYDIIRTEIDYDAKIVLFIFPAINPWFDGQHMLLKINHIIHHLPADYSLTPENVDKKIKTYLTFL